MIKEVTGELGSVFIVIEKEDGSTTWIPKDESNSDYQAYLKRDEPQAPLNPTE
jgi:hypothetical protein